MTDLIVAEKTCPRCGETKPLSGWNRNKATKDGLSSECRVCNIERVKASQLRRRERMGDEAFKAVQRKSVQRSRRYNPEVRERGKRQASAYAAALRRLREAHRSEFDALYARERYDRGLT